MASDGRLVFCDPIPRLQDMAAFEVALDLWVYYVECELSGRTNVVLNRECVTESYRTREAEIRRMTENLKLPKIIEGSIKKCVKSICAQVLSLSAYCRDFVFFDRMAREHLCDVVWRPDGTINYEKIIGKVIKSNEMNERQRFALMCEYCMEEEIRTVWGSLKDRNFIDEAQLDKNPMIVYWDCVMKNDFSKMEVDTVADAEKRILGSFRSYNLKTVEYFFNRLNDDERIEYGIKLMKNGGARLAKFLIPKFSETEQRRLFNTSNFFIKLIKIFAASDVNYALQTWIRMRNLVTGEQFVRMLEKIGRTRGYYDQVHELLVEIWRSSPNHLKQYVYTISQNTDPISLDMDTVTLRKNFLYDFCIRSVYMSSEPRQRDDDILVEVLLDAEPKFREKIWRSYWTDIVVQSRPSYLRNIMKLCLSADDLAEFKSNMMSSEVILRYFTNLIASGRYSDLDEFLRMIVDGEQTEMIRMRRQLLEDAKNIASIVRHCDQTESSVAMLGKFLAEVFENDENSLAQFEQKMILECINPTALCTRYELVRIFHVSEHLCSEQTLIKVKDEILQKCKTMASGANYQFFWKRPEWEMLLLWCLGTEGEVAEFQRSVS